MPLTAEPAIFAISSPNLQKEIVTAHKKTPLMRPPIKHLGTGLDGGKLGRVQK
jgi:hypothetical protein